METIRTRVEKVIKDFGGNKEKALRHFEKTSRVENLEVYSSFGVDIKKAAEFEAKCAEYLKSIM